MHAQTGRAVSRPEAETQIFFTAGLIAPSTHNTPLTPTPPHTLTRTLTSICARLSRSSSWRRSSSTAACPPPSILRRSMASLVSLLTHWLPAGGGGGMQCGMRGGWSWWWVSQYTGTRHAAERTHGIRQRVAGDAGMNSGGGLKRRTWVPSAHAERAEDEATLGARGARGRVVIFHAEGRAARAVGGVCGSNSNSRSMAVWVQKQWSLAASIAPNKRNGD